MNADGEGRGEECTDIAASFKLLEPVLASIYPLLLLECKICLKRKNSCRDGKDDTN